MRKGDKEKKKNGKNDINYFVKLSVQNFVKLCGKSSLRTYTT
jgi:hypothetical protein